MSTLLASLHRAAIAPALAGIYIKSVTVAATRDPHHDVWITITWSMPEVDIDFPTQGLPCVTATQTSRPSEIAARLPREMRAPSEIEDEILNVAWRLGAWDVVRCETAPLATGGDWREARHGISMNFGCNPYIIAGQAILTGEPAPDELCARAARDGYVHWRFKPLALAAPAMRRLWHQKDRTLDAACRRDGDPRDYRAAWRNPDEPHTAAEHVYQLGRSNHGNRGKTTKDRRA